MVNNGSIKIEPIIDSKLEFNKHFDFVMTKVNNMKTLLEKLRNILPQDPLLTLYKNFVRQHLDFDDVVYDKVCNNKIFHKKILNLFNRMLIHI